MVKAKRGDVFSCEICGVILTVDEIGLGMAEISCCKMDMAKGKAAAEKARKKTELAMKATAKAPAKAAVKAPAKAAVKAPAKAAVKAPAKAAVKAPVKAAAKAPAKAAVKAPAKAAAKAPVKGKK